MANKYKLTYFDITGLGESIRFLFNYGGIEFVDDRFELDNDKWFREKNNYLYGLLPNLEFEGKRINQSLAISRYLAKKVGLVGKNDLEDLEIDAIADTQNDLRLKFTQFFLEKDENQKAKYKDALVNEILPFYLEKFEKLVKENGGHFFGGKLTWADFNFVGFLDTWKYGIGQDIIEGYPNLIKLRETVENLPAIKQWIRKRPKCDY